VHRAHDAAVHWVAPEAEAFAPAKLFTAALVATSLAIPPPRHAAAAAQAADAGRSLAWVAVLV
jgi:hypothetical protein